MTRDEAVKMISILQAYVDGKTVQYDYSEQGIWKDFDIQNNWSFNPANWRIKPEPKVIWVNEYGNEFPDFAYSSESAAKDDKALSGVKKVAVKYVEVIE